MEFMRIVDSADLVFDKDNENIRTYGKTVFYIDF